MAPLPSGAYATLRIKSTTNSDSAKSVMGTESVLAKQVGGRETRKDSAFMSTYSEPGAFHTLALFSS